jgi:DNA-binding response OmpR family regulator
VFRGKREIQLTAREFELLEYLARHAGEVVSKETLFERVWGYDFDVESDAIKVYISYLRKKLNASGERDLIQAIRGVGYVLKP